MNNKGRGGIFEKWPLFCLSAFVGKPMFLVESLIK